MNKQIREDYVLVALMKETIQRFPQQRLPRVLAQSFEGVCLPDWVSRCSLAPLLLGLVSITKLLAGRLLKWQKLTDWTVGSVGTGSAQSGTQRLPLGARLLLCPSAHRALAHVLMGFSRVAWGHGRGPGMMMALRNVSCEEQTEKMMEAVVKWWRDGDAEDMEAGLPSRAGCPWGPFSSDPDIL